MSTATIDKRPLVTVEQWWLDELLSALDAATTIGMRSCRPGDGLHYANHDRLLRIALANGWTEFDQFRSLENGSPGADR